MSASDTALAAYQQAVNKLTSNCDATNLLEALVARDWVATELGNSAPNGAMIANVAGADRALKQAATKFIQLAGSAQFVDWRDARRCNSRVGFPEGNDWWWSLDAIPIGDSRRVRALNYVLWGIIVISLSFIVESLRRFLTGEVGVLGTVLQALVTLLVGSAVVELAKQVTIRRSEQNQGLRKPTLKRRSVFSLVLIGIAFVMWFLLPAAVKYYSNRGVTERYGGELSNPISRFQRTISLDPSDAIAHYSLARAYEVIDEYGKAEEEYKSAIRWDDRIALAYDGLAHLLLVQKKDYVNALRLVNSGFTKLEDQKRTNDFKNDDDYTRIRASLLGNQAWAYFGLGYITQAEDDLREVIRLRDKSAAPQCLLGQVLDQKAKIEDKSAKMDSTDIQRAYQNCVAFSHEQEDKIEADWLVHAQERLNQFDKAETQGTDKNQPKKKQGKKS